METRVSRKKYFICYTIIFAVLCIFVYGYFWDAGKSFIYSQANNDGDGLIQHYTALCYYASYLRDIIKTLLFQHRFVLPEWSFSLGYGSNILTTLHYYVVGDPFSLPAVLVPTRFMPYYYSFMILFRMYCAGLAFSAYSFHMLKNKRKYNERAVFAGVIIYVFCLFGMSAGIKHPYFINPMIFFPLLLLGAEKIMKKQSPVLFMVTVAVSACSNFYFFYMLVILTAVYVFVRLYFQYGIRGGGKIKNSGNTGDAYISLFACRTWYRNDSVFTGYDDCFSRQQIWQRSAAANVLRNEILYFISGEFFVCNERRKLVSAGICSN